MNTTAGESPHPIHAHWSSGAVDGEDIEESIKTLGQLGSVFHDEKALRQMDPATEVYRVRFWRPVPDGTPGGLFWGVTVLQPGRVGDEYFMTHGHFHAIRDRAEFYATVKGTGLLLLMNEAGEAWSQAMNPGSVHYIPGRTAHRVVNTGNEPLIFFASWPSDAGHDYAAIRASGFGKRVVQRDGKPCLI